jgi:hypothetical protein
MKAPVRVRQHRRKPIASHRFDIHAAKARLHRFHDSGRTSELAMYRALRNFGLVARVIEIDRHL